VESYLPGWSNEIMPIRAPLGNAMDPKELINMRTSGDCVAAGSGSVMQRRDRPLTAIRKEEHFRQMTVRMTSKTHHKTNLRHDL
jgi:hypothetical protein